MKILKTTKSIRLRLSSLEPDRIDEVLGEVLSHERICPHFHIPVQSGSNKVLNKMERRYDREQVKRVVEILRKAKKDPFLAADLITGFPGETPDYFKDTLALFRDLDFAFGHIFTFSPRPGTEAFEMTPKIPERISGERAKILQTYSSRQHLAYILRFSDRELDFLAESKRDSLRDGGFVNSPSDKNTRSVWTGTTENYLKPIIKDAPEDACLGEIWKIRLLGFEETGRGPLKGSFLRKL